MRDPALTCVARVVPIKESRVRPCGVIASCVFEGRPLCSRHLKVAKRRAEQREEARRG